MLRRALLGIAVAAAVCAAIASYLTIPEALHPGVARHHARAATPSNITVAAYYYVWYGRGLGGRHWNDSVLGAVVDEPAIGYYSSMNLTAVEWQLRMIRGAGIDVLFISWWGPGSYEDRAAQKVFKLLPRYGLKAAIMVEPFLGSGLAAALTRYGPSFWARVLPYIARNFILKYRNTYFRLDGKPLILTYAPVGLLYLPRTGKYVFRVVATHVDLLKALGLRADWDLWPDYLAPWVRPRASISLRVRVDGYVAVTPRFDRASCVAGMTKGPQCGLALDPNYTLGAYVMEWEWVLKHRSSVRIVAIYSWNEYHERSEIEPHHDATKPPWLHYSPYLITKEFVARLKGWVKTVSNASARSPEPRP